MPRKKKPPAREWLGNWSVTYEWGWRGQVLRSRAHDFRVKDEREHRDNRWFMFNRHVINHDKTLADGTPATWVDGFDPAGGFVSYRPEQIIAVRPHKEVKRKINDEPAKPTGGTRRRGRPPKKS